MFRINCSIDPIHFFVGAIACQTKPASLDVAKRTFYLSDQRIRTLYHYGEGRITRESAMHYKDRHLNAQAAAGGDAAPSKGGTVDEIAEDLQTVLASERDTLQEIRRLFVEVNGLLKQRRREEDSSQAQHLVCGRFTR